MSNNYEIPISIPITSSEHESVEAPCNLKVLEDMEFVLQELADWERLGNVYEKRIGEEIRLRMHVNRSRALVAVERSVSGTVLNAAASEERVRQSQVLKAFQMQCTQAVNEVFDRAYVRAIERATRQLGDIQVERQYDQVNCINSVRVLIRIEA
jgi:hypothetical protein